MNDFQKRLLERMNDLGIKPNELCKKTGIKKSSLSYYMSGKVKAKQINLTRLANALYTNEAWLMGFDVPIEPSTHFDLVNNDGLDITGLSDKDLGVVKAVIAQLKNKN